MIMSHSTGTSPMQVHSEPCGGTKMIILRTAEIIGQEHWHPKMSWERIFQATIVQIINGAHQFCAVLTNMIKCHWPKSLKVDVLLIFNTLTCNLCNLMLLIYRPALLISNDQWTRLPQDFLNWPSLAFWLLLAPHCLSVARRCTTGIDARPDPQKLTKPGRRNGARLIVDSKIMSWNPNFIWEGGKRRKSSGPVFSLWLYFSLFRPTMQTFTLAHPARFFLCPARNKMPGLAHPWCRTQQCLLTVSLWGGRCAPGWRIEPQVTDGRSRSNVEKWRLFTAVHIYSGCISGPSWKAASWLHFR